MSERGGGRVYTPSSGAAAHYAELNYDEDDEEEEDYEDYDQYYSADLALPPEHRQVFEFGANFELSC